jgi:hypothetical protein
MVYQFVPGLPRLSQESITVREGGTKTVALITLEPPSTQSWERWILSSVKFAPMKNVSCAQGRKKRREALSPVAQS